MTTRSTAACWTETGLLRVQPSACHWPLVKQEKLISTPPSPSSPPCSPCLLHLAGLPSLHPSLCLFPLALGGPGCLPILGGNKNRLQQHSGPWLLKFERKLHRLPPPLPPMMFSFTDAWCLTQNIFFPCPWTLVGVESNLLCNWQFSNDWQVPKSYTEPLSSSSLGFGGAEMGYRIIKLI